MFRLPLVPTLAAVAGSCLVFSLASGEELEDGDRATILEEIRALRAEVRELRSPQNEQPPAESATDASESTWFPPLSPRPEVVVITPLRRESDLKRSPAQVTVIDAEDIRQRGQPLRVQDQWQGRSGVYMTSNGSYGGVTALRLRGTRSFDTRVLQDGLPVVDPSTPQGNMDLSRLSTVGIERTEMLFGAQSGLYGSQAIGGVVDMRTARPTAEHQRRVQVQGGSMHTYNTDVVLTGPLSSELGYALSIRGVRSDGISATYREADYDNLVPTVPAFGTPLTQSQSVTNQFNRNFRYSDESTNPIPFDLRPDNIAPGNHANHEKDGFAQATVRGRLEWQPHEDALWYAAAEGTLGRNDYDGFNQPDDHDSRSRVRDLRYSAGGEIQVHEDVQVLVDGLWADSKREESHVDSLVGQDRLFVGQTAFASVRLQWQLNELLSWDAGLDFERQAIFIRKGSGVNDVANVADFVVNDRWAFSFPSTPPAIAQIRNEIDPFASNRVYDVLIHDLNAQPRDESARTIGAWGGVQVDGDDYTFNATLRHDRHQREGDATTFRVGGAWWALGERLRLQGSVGTGFRAPSLFEQFSTFGNADLKAERTVGYELGVELRPWSWLELAATWYRTNYSERIDFDFSQGYINTGSDARVSGVEYRLFLAPEDAPWQLSAYFNPQRSSETAAPGIRQAALRTPDRLAGVEGSWEFAQAWVTLGVRHVGSRRVSGGGNVGGIPIPNRLSGYQVVYGAAGWRPYPGWEIFIRGENLGDEDYLDVPGFAPTDADFTTLRPSAWLGVEATF